MTYSAEPDGAPPGIDRARLAAAMRHAASRERDNAHARAVAESVIASSVTDHPERRSAWSGDGRERLTTDQAVRAVRSYVHDLAPQCPDHSCRPQGPESGCPGCERHASEWERIGHAVITAYNHPPASPDPGKPSEGEDVGRYRPRCSHCGNPYTPGAKSARYCSQNCRQAAYRARKATALRTTPGGASPVTARGCPAGAEGHAGA